VDDPRRGHHEHHRPQSDDAEQPERDLDAGHSAACDQPEHRHAVPAGGGVGVSIGRLVEASAESDCYLLLMAEFVAWVQVLIYVGAVVVLLLFAVSSRGRRRARQPSSPAATGGSPSSSP